MDPTTRMLWTPYLQVMAELTARNVRFPSWLSRASMADLFPLDRTAGTVEGGVVP